VYLGIAFYFAVRGNLTYTLLPFLAVFAGLMISYTRARAEDLIQFCTVGYWQRGERFTAVIIAVFAHNVPALLWQQALAPMFTVWARIRYTWQVASGRQVVPDPRRSGRASDRLRLWRYPRRTIPYEIVAIAHIAFLIFARIPADFDPLGRALGLS
jgi:phosphatidylglycerophosphate synthase